MKAQDLWAGTEYAYIENKSRGIETPTGANRVKIIRTFRKVQPRNQRMSTFAEVEFLDKETGRTKGIVRTVRARDIFDWWDDYADRVADLERRQKEAEAEKQRIEQEKKDQRATLKTELHLKTGIPLQFIQFDFYGRIVLDGNSIRGWLDHE